jgi:hypothetical protein
MFRASSVRSRHGVSQNLTRPTSTTAQAGTPFDADADESRRLRAFAASPRSMNLLVGVRMLGRRFPLDALPAPAQILRIGALNGTKVVVPRFPLGVPGAEAEYDWHVV